METGKKISQVMARVSTECSCDSDSKVNITKNFSDQKVSFYVVVACTPGKATIPIPEKRRYLKSAAITRPRLFLIFEAAAKVMESGRRTDGLVTGLRLPYLWINPEMW